MKCPVCKGRKEAVCLNGVLMECNFCGGKGFVEPMTNKEWMQTANDEELAETILQYWQDGAYCGLGEFGLKQKEVDSKRHEILQWLKEKHE